MEGEKKFFLIPVISVAGHSDTVSLSLPGFSLDKAKLLDICPVGVTCRDLGVTPQAGKVTAGSLKSEDV